MCLNRTFYGIEIYRDSLRVKDSTGLNRTFYGIEIIWRAGERVGILRVLIVPFMELKLGHRHQPCKCVKGLNRTFYGIEIAVPRFPVAYHLRVLIVPFMELKFVSGSMGQAKTES